MNNDEKIEQMIRSYKFTVVALSVIIIAIVVAIAVILLSVIPHIVHDQFVTVLTEWSEKTNK